MNNIMKIGLVSAIMLVGTMSGLASNFSSDADDSPIVYNSYEVVLEFSGQGAVAVVWSFGDGTPDQTGFKVKHVYSEKGIYTVTQTSINPIGSTSATLDIDIRGDPVVTFESNGGSSAESKVLPYVDQKPQTIGDLPIPQKDGCSFEGWYLDPELTMKCDSDQVVKESMTLYAAYEESSGSMLIMLLIVALAIVVLFILILVYIRRKKEKE